MDPGAPFMNDTALEEQRSEKYRHALIAVVSIGVRAGQLAGPMPGSHPAWYLTHQYVGRDPPCDLQKLQVAPLTVPLFLEGRHGGWADIGNLHVAGQHRRHGVATWLLGQAADWLRLAQAERLLSYAWLEGQDPTGQDYTAYRAFLAASGFLQLTRTKRGWTRTPHSPR